MKTVETHLALPVAVMRDCDGLHTSNLTTGMATLQSMKQTLTQSEQLKIGESGIYTPKAGGVLETRCKALGIECWIDKRTAPVTEADKNLRTFIDIPFGYSLVYGITYKGKDYDCGDMPRDLGGVVKGIAIASGIV